MKMRQNYSNDSRIHHDDHGLRGLRLEIYVCAALAGHEELPRQFAHSDGDPHYLHKLRILHDRDDEAHDSHPINVPHAHLSVHDDYDVRDAHDVQSGGFHDDLGFPHARLDYAHDDDGPHHHENDEID